ncbi:MAG: DNA replication ATP-dependent helicase Dna2 [Verrucomicrobiales bacterium]|jgi:DNA replication ATP-dependent helicase Dna2
MGNQVDRQRAFLLELHELVDEEAAAQYLALNKLYHLPLAQRIAKGRALEKVRIERREDNRLIARFGHNASVYRPGDFVQIGRGDPLMDDRFQVTIEGEGEHHFELEIFHCAVDLKLEDPDGWVIEDSHYDLSDRYRTALNEAGETAVGRDRILPLLMGETEPIIAPERYEHGERLGSTLISKQDPDSFCAHP